MQSNQRITQNNINGNCNFHLEYWLDKGHWKYRLTISVIESDDEPSRPTCGREETKLELVVDDVIDSDLIDQNEL
jgi:hypothetical protein